MKQVWGAAVLSAALYAAPAAAEPVSYRCTFDVADGAVILVADFDAGVVRATWPGRDNRAHTTVAFGRPPESQNPEDRFAEFKAGTWEYRIYFTQAGGKAEYVADFGMEWARGQCVR